MATRNMQTREGYEIWDRLCAIPRFGFLLAPEGNRVVAAKGIGNWINMHAAQEVVDDAQSQVNILKEQRDALLAALNELRQTQIGVREFTATEVGDIQRHADILVAKVKAGSL